jgi:hypothetical protein
MNIIDRQRLIAPVSFLIGILFMYSAWVSQNMQSKMFYGALSNSIYLHQTLENPNRIPVKGGYIFVNNRDFNLYNTLDALYFLSFLGLAMCGVLAFLIFGMKPHGKES